MWRARITFDGAFHHGMNRGYEGRPVFEGDQSKHVFLELLEKSVRLTKTRLLAYCIMDNHYHLILENTNGRMSDFFKRLNGEYGNHYRKMHGGKGYVFQSRFKSTLIQDDPYLLLSIAYVLNNPVKARLVKDFREYSWSSASLYYSDNSSAGVDKGFVEELFETRDGFKKSVRSAMGIEQLPMMKTEMGMIIGGEDFVSVAMRKADRRSGRQSMERKRKRDMFFEPVEKILMEFEQKHGIQLNRLDFGTLQGKRLRSELLVHLKERSGLTYSQIARLDYFANLSINSLGSLYHRFRNK